MKAATSLFSLQGTWVPKYINGWFVLINACVNTIELFSPMLYQTQESRRIYDPRNYIGILFQVIFYIKPENT